MDYREILRVELRRRQRLAPKYSLRDFAKSLGLSPAHVSYLLRGRRGLSKKSANKVSYALGLVNEFRKAFYFSVMAQNARRRAERGTAVRTLQKPVFWKAWQKIIATANQDISWQSQVRHLQLPTSFECHQMWRRMKALGLR